ncbi:hypothetical protein D3C78_1386950 [compost metagenome]
MLNQYAPLSFIAIGQYSTYTSPELNPELFTLAMKSLLKSESSVLCASISAAAAILLANVANTLPLLNSFEPNSIAAAAILASAISPFTRAVVRWI